MGQNSKQNKNYRQLNDIQIHMRLRTSANQAQIRQHYVPALAAHIVDPFVAQGSVRRLPPFALAPPRSRSPLTFHACRADETPVPLCRAPQDAVDGVIDFMDGYFLNKEDWEAMIELGVGARAEEGVLKSIPTAVKAAFTKRCIPSRRVR